MDLEEILQNPEVQELTANLNAHLKKQRAINPFKCEVFNSAYTHLTAMDQYQFHIHTDAKKYLPAIVNKKVNKITGSNVCLPKWNKARKIGVVFSGGPAPGGHNVLAGLFDAAKQANPDTKIYGFIGGPDGIIENTSIEITRELIDRYRNRGGFCMIKTGRTKIDTPEKINLCRQTCQQLNLDALIIIGGDDSNTNAAFLAQALLADKIQVIGVPKTIDGDIQVRDKNGEVLCAVSFGFHSAARAFATEIGNLCTDADSDVKYWHICKVMGRVASHLALETALQTHPNMTFIGEDLADYIDHERLEKVRTQKTTDFTAYGMTLRHLSRVICNGIRRRAAKGKNYGIIVIPEGLLEFINEIQVFIIKLNTIIAKYNKTHDLGFHVSFPLLSDKLDYLRKLARQSRENQGRMVWNTRDDDLFNVIPDFFQEGLLMERDSHGNFPFSQVDTDKVLMDLVKDYLNTLKEKGLYKIGIKKDYFIKAMQDDQLDPDFYGSKIFIDYAQNQYLMIKPEIFSLRTLKAKLVRTDVIKDNEKIPTAIKKIFKQSIPVFKTQHHFYGYDGRGSDPTSFDCTYAYNLGLTVFSLVSNGATGLMAAIKNLELNFNQWEPLGIPIAPLMHLEERNGELALVLEKTIVDTDSTAFQVFKHHREDWLAATTGEDNFRQPGPTNFDPRNVDDKPLTLALSVYGRNKSY